MSTVENGNTVSVHYKGTLNDGTEFDNSRTRGEPLTFQVGSGMMIPGFDSGVLGMSIGETKNLSLTAEEGYGEKNDEALQEVSKQFFPPEFNFTAGEMVQGTTPEGQPLLAKIISEAEETVVLDFNHPLAGEGLNFEVELMEIKSE